MTPPTPGAPASPPASGTVPSPYEPLALYGPDFAADPHGHYRRLRAQGPLGRVRIAPGVDALLVTDYQAAVDLLRDTDTFSKDPRAWQAGIPEDSPVLPVLGYRPTALFSDGAVHTRYREAVNDTLALLEPHLLRAYAAQAAQQFIATFSATGTGDLIAQYARLLPLRVFSACFGVAPRDSERLLHGVAGMMDSAANAAAAYADLVAVVAGLVAERRVRPGRDLTTYLLAHPAGLDDDEAVRQITLIISAGHDPTTNLIGNALLRMLSDTGYGGSLHGGAMTAREAIDEVLWRALPTARHRVPRGPAARRPARPGLLRRRQHPVPARRVGPRRPFRRRGAPGLVGRAAQVPREAARPADGDDRDRADHQPALRPRTGRRPLRTDLAPGPLPPRPGAPPGAVHPARHPSLRPPPVPDTKAPIAFRPVSVVRRTGEGRENCPMNSERSRRTANRHTDGVVL